jgi:hypothetical protein
MACLYSSISKVGSVEYYAVLSGNDPFDLYVDGVLQSQNMLFADPVSGHTTNEEYWYFNGDAYEPDAAELRDADSTGTAESVLYPPYLILQWRGDDDAESYLIQQYVDSAWSDIANVAEDNKGYYQYQTVALTDATTHQWRVLPVDHYGNEGTPVQFDMFLVRNPDTPSYAVTWDAGTNEIVVSAR